MQKRFIFGREDRPGEAWAARYAAGREEARRWYLGARTAAVPAGPGFDWRAASRLGPTAAECRDALGRHMPELVDEYDRVCVLVDGDELDRRVLSHFRPAPDAPGCTLAVWHGEGGPALVRQQDFPLHVTSERFELTQWSGRRVIGKAQRPWGGLHDGMNDAGLVVTSTFGGGQAQGPGFAIILVARYLLETCSRVGEAVRAMRRLPVPLPHNVMMLDREGDYATVFVGPDREPAVTANRVTTNHQETVVWPELARRSQTVERLAAVEAALADPRMTLDGLVARFLEPPIHSRSAHSPTVYTAVYRPAEATVDYIWPGKVVRQSFQRFEEGEYEHDFNVTASD